MIRLQVEMKIVFFVPFSFQFRFY